MSSQALSQPDNVAQQAVDRWRVIKAAQSAAAAAAASTMRRQMSEVRSLVQTLGRRWGAPGLGMSTNEWTDGRKEGNEEGREGGRQGHNMQLYAININHSNCHKKRNVHFECGRARTNELDKEEEGAARENARTRAKIGSNRNGDTPG